MIDDIGKGSSKFGNQVAVELFGSKKTTSFYSKKFCLWLFGID